jgi:hypothetical protein
MEPQIVHFKKYPYDVYIGRPSKWGNPYSRKPGIAKHKVTTKAESLNKHREWVLNNPSFVEEIKRELKGKILGCWCDNFLACHGLILWKLANDIPLFDDAAAFTSPTLF